MKDDVAKIAAGLSEEARECFDWVTPCSGIAPFRAGAMEVFNKGLVSKDRTMWFHVTPLGLKVRTHLLKDKTHDRS